MKKTNEHKENRQDTSTSGPQLCRGHVPFVPWKCPVCPADILSNLCGITQKSGGGVLDVSGLAPEPSPGHFQTIPTTKFLHVFFVYPFFPLPNFSQARKKSTKINFLGPETARWGGGLPLEGVVAENFVPALESLSSLGFEERNLGHPGNFAGMSRTPGGVRKVCAKKLRAHFSFPNFRGRC